MSKTPMRHRIFAGMGAALFLLTASALTIAVVVDMVSGNGNTSTTAQNADTKTTDTCTASSSITTDVKLAAPEKFIPDGAVTDIKTTDIKTGDGATAKIGECLQMKYYGTLASDGTRFDDNYSTNNLFQFKLGSGQVIAGWDVGISGMKVGGIRRLVIPSDLGYGAQGSGIIPANAALVFEVHLINIVK